ncbi:hypothetical protein ACFSMW_00715 [Virgibacillus halophilus]|uniref:hypothetical protein n=1 Tax=Tigheibacillus halophilus TaxID=361280 RepID=UPI00363DCEB0
MSTYDAFLEEKLQVDSLLKQGYTIIGLNGTLDGDVVEFEDKLRADKKTLLLTNPDSRKYFATRYIKQRELEKE